MKRNDEQIQQLNTQINMQKNEQYILDCILRLETPRMVSISSFLNCEIMKRFSSAAGVPLAQPSSGNIISVPNLMPFQYPMNPAPQFAAASKTTVEDSKVEKDRSASNKTEEQEEINLKITAPSKDSKPED